MIGVTLVASRHENFFPHFGTRFRQLGFSNVTFTNAGNDGLNMLIYELKPRILIIGAGFYDCCTPFMMTDLHKTFPKLNIAAVSVTDYPADLAMYFIVNGVKSYVNYWEGPGPEPFYKGLEEIREGREYVSPEVQRRIDMRSINPRESGILTGMQIEITRLVGNGYTGAEIAGTLHISERSVDSRKSEIYTALNVRNENEAVRVALCLKIIDRDELNFFGRNYMLKPLPPKQRKTKNKNKTIGAVKNDCQD